MKKVLAALALLLPALVHAESYRMDVIVFVDKFAAGELSRGLEVPDLNKSIELDNAAALASAGIRLLDDAQFGLNDQWQRLKNSKRFQPVIRLAWIQKDPPAERGPSLHVKWGESLTISDGNSTAVVRPVEGSVALLAGHYLHLDADLVYTQRSENGALSYRLNEKRKLKRDELHHLDSPRLGILVRATKAQ